MNHKLTGTIIYDDDEIRVVWSPASSDFVVITFGDMISQARDQRFFADIPLQRSGVAAIGVMAKRGNWYPSEHLQKASKYILDKIGAYNTRITYGGSMGGYAAVKFSGLLSATHAVALCPQWSIDPAECQGFDPGWGNHFRPAMSGMSIRARDVVGKVFLFVDAFHRRDMFHCVRITENYPGAYLINVPVVEHNVITVFAGTGNLLQLINACRDCDADALRRFSRQVRKKHPVWLRGILRYALRKLPRLGIRLLVDADRDLLGENWRYFPQILGHLATTAGAERAVSFYEKSWSLLPGAVEQQLICAFLVSITGGRIGIATQHESWLIYNLSENRVLHKGAPLALWEIPVQAKRLDSAAALFVIVGGIEFRLSVNNLGGLDVPATKDRREDSFLFEIRSGENGRFTISHGAHHLSAEKNNEKVSCKSTKAQQCEMFRFRSL